MKITLKKPSASNISAVDTVPAIDRLFNSNQVAEILGVSLAFLSKDRNLARRNNHEPRIPYVQVGAAVRYRQQDVQAFIETGGRSCHKPAL